MNYNDLLAQQQALLNQTMRNAQIWQAAGILISVALFLLAAWVVYMFYARLRDIAVELKKFRIAFEMANPPARTLGARQESRSGPPALAPRGSPKESEADSRYMPKG
ncbi:MAG: hypothetical protein ACYDH9_24200 [Limisphaerales bacterium]